MNNPIRTLRLIERKRKQLRLSPSQVAQMQCLNPRIVELQPMQRTHHYSITPRGFIGSISTESLRIEIQSKIPHLNLAWLLGIDSLSNPTLFPINESMHLDEWIGSHFLRLMTEKQSEHLSLRYETQPQASDYLRGQLIVPEQIREQARLGSQFHTRSDELTFNHLENQLILAACNRLLEQFELSQSVRAALQLQRNRWPLVSQLPADWREQSQRRLSGEPLILLSTWILDAERIGINRLFPLEPLFERFLARQFQTIAPEWDYWIQPPIRLESTSHRSITLHPDLVIGQNQQPLAVVDAKWKTARNAPEPQDLQQVLAYATLLGATSAHLIYPSRVAATEQFHHTSNSVHLFVHRIPVAGPIERAKTQFVRWQTRFIRKIRDFISEFG